MTEVVRLYFLNISDTNCDPLSLNTECGGPNNDIHRSYALIIVIVLISLTGTSRQNLENLSMMDTMYLFPDFVIGNGPQMSMDIISNGYFRETDEMALDLNAVFNGFRPPLTDWQE